MQSFPLLTTPSLSGITLSSTGSNPISHPTPQYVQTVLFKTVPPKKSEAILTYKEHSILDIFL
jgi:hypothetical protein